MPPKAGEGERLANQRALDRIEPILKALNREEKTEEDGKRTDSGKRAEETPPSGKEFRINGKLVRMRRSQGKKKEKGLDWCYANLLKANQKVHLKPQLLPRKKKQEGEGWEGL